MEKPPRSKRQQSSGPQKQQHAATAPPRLPQEAVRKAPQRPHTMAPPPPPANKWASGEGWIGRMQQQMPAASVGDSAPMDIERFPRLGEQQQQPRPNLIAAANAAATALVYQSPQTDPRSEPPVTRAAQAEGRGALGPTMQQRLAAVAPRGRIQRKEWLSEEQKRQLKVAVKRARREQDKRLQLSCAVHILHAQISNNVRISTPK